MTGITADVRFAMRALWRHRGFTIAVVLTLAVGVGVTSAVFQVYRAALLRPLAVSEPDRLVFLHRFETGRGYYSSASYPAFIDYRARAADLVDFAAYTTGSVSVEHRGTRRLPAAMVSAEYFHIAGVSPLRGRVFGAGDDAHAAVISEKLWLDSFDRDESVIGRTVAVAGRAATIVGVLPASFGGFDRETPVDVWVPLETEETFQESVVQRGRDWLEMPGRLRPAVSREQADAALRTIGASLATERPDTDANWRLVLSPGAQGNIYPHVRGKMVYLLSVMSAAALLLLLVTCGTAANLGIARVQSRSRELRVRLAIGAGRRHLLRLLAIEHALVAAGAAAAGALLATWIPDIFAAYTLPGAVKVSELSLRFDAAQAGFTAALLVTLVFALTALTAPGWWRTRRIAAPGAERAPERLLVRRTLVAAQVAMSLALLFGGGLLFKTLRSQMSLDATFRSQRLLMATMALPAARPGTPAPGSDMFRSIRDHVAATEGVAAASWSFTVPYGARRMQTSMTPDGTPDGEPRAFDANVVDVDYFRTVGIPILRGRAFTEADRQGAERVIIVTESLAARYWPGRDPLRRRIAGRSRAASWTIVGVVPDDLHYDIRTLRGGQREYVFFPLAQMYQDAVAMFGHSMTLLVATEGDPLAVADRVRTILAAEAPRAEPAITTARRHVDATLSQEWLAATAATAIAALALVLAIVGLYGIVRYTVTQRTREIGIRVALGATPRAIVRLALGDAAWTLVPGTAAGLAALVPVALTIRPLLHNVRPFDAAVLAASIALTAACALAAVWIPARAAGRIDPADALRLE